MKPLEDAQQERTIRATAAQLCLQVEWIFTSYNFLGMQLRQLRKCDHSHLSPAGYYIPSGTVVFYACLAGYYSGQGWTSCALAGIGTYTPLPAMASTWSCSGAYQQGARYCNTGGKSDRTFVSAFLL